MKKKLYSLFIYLFFSVVLILGITYILWRWMYTLNLLTSPFTTFWSYALCIAEVLTLIVFTNFSLILLKSSQIEQVKPDNKLQNDYSKDIFFNETLVTFKNYCPSVDIFICTLNEDADMLSTTISACKNIDYPNHKVYVLDDGRRDEIKELTEMLGCNYIKRDTNKGFKSGNINNALSLTDGEIVVIFDADHIPASTFLKETVFNFIDNTVALVQTPQHFCNPDAFQKNLLKQNFLSNEQDMFYRVIEPSLNEYDSVFCGGTNILLKRELLNSVGNFPENSITEDSLLGLKFHAKGYKVLYYNRPIAIGLAASSFEEYIKQRCRWAKGNVQIVTDVNNWKYYTKLKPMQLFFYLSGVLYFFTPIARLIFLIAPVLFLFFDITPVLILFYQIIIFQVCYFGLKFIFIYSSKVNFHNVIYADVYDLVTSIFTIGSILNALLIPRKLSKLKFAVTKKDLLKINKNYKYSLTIIVLFLVLIAAEMQGIYDIMFSEPYSVLAIIANLFWNTINIIVLYLGLNVVLDKPEKREYQRIKVSNSVKIENEKDNYFTEVNDISRSGLNVISPENLENTSSKVDIDGDKNDADVLNCNKEKMGYNCRLKFKNPIKLVRLTKIYIYKINKFVKFVYKNPDRWDDFFNKK